jgi:hypothetical protein
MCLVDAGASGSRWDEVMRQLARWLIRHLDDPALLLWLVKRGGQVHDDLVRLIERRLNELTKLERAGNRAELARIRANAAKAIPGPMMRTLWALLLTGRVKSWLGDFDLYRWRERFKRAGLSATLRLELREMLTPRVSLREPFRLPAEDGESQEPERIKDLVEWELVLSTDHVHSSLRDLPKDERWTAALPELLSDFSGLLLDALDLMRELGSAEDRNDLSYMHQPSISEHRQNKDFHDWTALIDLTRDAWLATGAPSPARAALVAELWWHTPYPLFRRLAFFAAAQGGVIPHRRALDWLLADDQWWLWSVETKREAMRLLVAQAPQLDEAMLRELELAILAGPPRAMFKDDIKPERWTRIVEREFWLRLATIGETGADLDVAGKDRLETLSAQYPEWTLAPDQRDEFPYWMGDGDDWRKFVATPRRRRELIEWLKQQLATDHWQEDDWRQRCRDNFATTACALCALTREGVWQTDRWRKALQAWSEEKLLRRSWRYMAPVLAGVPNDHPTLDHFDQRLMLDAIEALFQIQVQDPVHRPLLQDRLQRLQRLVRASLRAKSVAEVAKVLLVHTVEHFHHRTLNELVLNARDADRTLPAIRLLYPVAPRRQRPIPARLQAGLQRRKIRRQPFSIAGLRLSVDPCRCLGSQASIRPSQRLLREQMRQRSEPLLTIDSRSLLHPLKFRADGAPPRRVAHLSLQQAPCPAPPFAPPTRAARPSPASSLL